MNPKVLEPKDDRDELTVEYWKASQFDRKNIPPPQPHDVDDTHQPCARKYSYFEDGTSCSIAKSQLDQFHTYITEVFVTLNNDHYELIKGISFWKELSKGLKNTFWKELHIKFPFLRYCDDNWKGQKFVVDYYHLWYVSFIEKGQDVASSVKLKGDSGDMSTSLVKQQKPHPVPVFTAQVFHPM